MELNHKGVAVEVLTNGKFRAIVEGETLLSASFDALKKRIDAKQKNAFVPFAALQENHYAKEGELPFFCRTVTGIDIERSRRWGSNIRFTLDSGSRTGYVILDTPENRVLIIQLCEMRAAAERVRKEEDDKIAELNKLLTKAVAAHFVTPKK